MRHRPLLVVAAILAGTVHAHAAGDVRALVRPDGLLLVVGDADGNAVRLHPDDDTGLPTLEPLDATTTVNGVAGPLVMKGATGHVLAQLGAGDDTLVVEDLELRGALTVVAGPGADHVELDDATIGGALALDGGPDADALVVGTSHVEGRTQLQGGTGDDAVTLDAATLGDRLQVATGSGNDTVHVGGASAVAGDAAVSTGGGKDGVAFDDAALAGMLRASLGPDDDALTVRATTVGGLVVLDGGGGIDAVTDGGGNHLGVGAQIRRFEPQR